MMNSLPLVQRSRSGAVVVFFFYLTELYGKELKREKENSNPPDAKTMPDNTRQTNESSSIPLSLSLSPAPLFLRVPLCFCVHSYSVYLPNEVNKREQPVAAVAAVIVSSTSTRIFFPPFHLWDQSPQSLDGSGGDHFVFHPFLIVVLHPIRGRVDCF